ncbi:MAG: HAD family phosphatase [Bacteroidales bacterium]|nr:HAD family phosphatase [Bacteroidales bacterium]
MDVKLIITDFDGTLVDTFEANYQAYRQAFEDENITLTRDKYREWFGFRFDRFIREIGIIDPEVKSRIKEKKAEYYPSYFQHIRINRPLLEFIRAFHRQGGLTAIASTARERNLRNALRHIDAETDFDLILAGENVSHGKPDPEIYLKVLKALDIRPDEALVFEDSTVGLEAARSAGIRTMTITQKFFS